MNNDPFSDIIKLTQAQSLVTGGFTAGGHWALRFPAPEKIKFFAIVKGSCWVILQGEPAPVRFSTGDVGLLSAKRSFILASHPDVEPVDAMSVFSGAGKVDVAVGEGDDFEHIGGHILLNPTSGKLLMHVLPPWIHIPAASDQAASFRWLLDQLVLERRNARAGSQLASAHLAQLLFIHILREYLQTSDVLSSGWLRILADKRLVPALQLIHGYPARKWHLEELAKSCAMSRTTFAQNFKLIAGMTPIAYLTQWRVRLAERALSEGEEQIAVVAHSLGYASVSAFNTIFKRETGLSPKAWRLAVRSSPAV
ncbi:cupin domain-containing protein [Ewingella allii]|uniref:AraC family transcriptional regulator n=1 Tax=Ewingella allii TaxID=3092550 RepID=UPI0037990919